MKDFLPTFNTRPSRRLSGTDDSKRLQAYFEKWAKELDRYYRPSEKSLLERGLDFIFRQSVGARFQLALAECKRFPGARILEVGCGSGRFAVSAVKGGAGHVTGVDFSPAMVQMAGDLAQKEGAADKCRFVCEDFLNAKFSEPFDVVVALGFFDYIKDPEVYLQKMKLLAKKAVIASFPAKWQLRNIIRIIRLASLNCPVYFYTSGQIRQIFKKNLIENARIHSLDRDFLAVITL